MYLPFLQQFILEGFSEEVGPKFSASVSLLVVVTVFGQGGGSKAKGGARGISYHSDDHHILKPTIS